MYMRSSWVFYQSGGQVNQLSNPLFWNFPRTQNLLVHNSNVHTTYFPYRLQGCTIALINASTNPNFVNTQKQC